MVFVIIVCIATCATMIATTLAKPKIAVKNAKISTYWLVTLFGALLLIVFGAIEGREVLDGLTKDSAINPLKILILFISMTILSIFLDETGFFRFLANFVLKKAGTNQIKLFTAFYFTISVFTVFTSNDIIILTFTPFICYFARNAKINPVPYLVSEFVAANTASMLLIIGNPTNIYLATSSGITFWQYLKVMSLPTLFAIIVAYTVMLLIFYKRLKAPIKGEYQNVKIEQKLLLAVGLILLGVCTVMLAISAYIKLEMWLIAACAATLLITVLSLHGIIKQRRPIELFGSLKRAPYELIPFVLSMFVLVLSLQKYEVTSIIADLLGEDSPVAVFGTISTLVANLMNNIPMSVLFSAVLKSGAVSAKGVYATIIGSNIGAFLTPIGALAGIMWLELLKQNNVEFSFARFFKFGIIIALPTLAAALLGLFIATI